MPRLVAVLDTNFWLSTHVLCVVTGYAAALLTALFGHAYLFSRIVGRDPDSAELPRALYRMTYGTACFALLFSVVGTILGGVWANDSWGRFWGWDPKENGALMICLWLLAMLHGRLGGHIRGFGFALASVVLAVIVAFSWWGVNLLQVGLHNYGWIEGVGTRLNTFYAVEAAVLATSVVWFALDRRRAPR
jgi:ABC-type transport system involved in cytochrome c biogenesis permease subunit